jgi:hypothetical protein
MQPTYLYIKKHRTTGIQYFGKTTKYPEKYQGSGKYWQNHIKIHGNNIETVWYCLFTDKKTLINFATNFSDQNNIIESEEWANLINENGLDGAPIGHRGHIFSDVQKAKISESLKKMWLEKRESIINAQKESWTLERKSKYSKSKLGIKRPMV